MIMHGNCNLLFLHVYISSIQLVLETTLINSGIFLFLKNVTEFSAFGELDDTEIPSSISDPLKHPLRLYNSC